MAFVRSTQSSILRGFERELKAASRGTLRGLAMLHWVCEEGVEAVPWYRFVSLKVEVNLYILIAMCLDYS